MSEPSEVALEMASRAMLGGPMQDKHMQYRIAAALQKLMDERDRARRNEGAIDEACSYWKARAEAAERERDQAVADARFLAGCARKLNDGDGLIEHAVDAGLTALRERIDGMFRAEQVEAVIARYPEVHGG